MDFNYLNNIESCFNFINFDAPLELVYYSHISTSVVAFLLSLFVLLSNRKQLINKLLFFFSVFFALFVIIDLITWTSYNSLHYMFFWSFFGILTALLYLICIYFSYVFIYKKDLPLKMKLVLLSLFLPITILTPTIFNLNGFYIIDCISVEVTWFTAYFHGLGIVALIWTIILLIQNYKKSNDKLFKKQILLMTLGINSFILILFFANFADVYLVSLGLTGDYIFGNYGLFGMTIFISFLAYMIVKFKAFNIKLLGAQALVWALIILVGSQFLYLADMSVTSTILTSITLILSAGIGLLVVRSVRQVDEQREMLDIANKNQESMLHFITHQIKGFMTKTRGIYAGILEGDYGEINGKVQAIVQYGLESETKGVDTIQNILNASNLKSGKLVFDKKEFDLTAMVKSIIEDFRKKITDKGLELEENISAKPIIFNGDELRIKEVLKNLLDNSIHYTEQGKVSVTLKVLGDKIKYSIKDTGIGLSPVDKKNLFQEGGRGEVSLTHNVESTGYGLYIAKKIVEEHKGKIWAESEGRDKGSEFIVELPFN